MNSPNHREQDSWRALLFSFAAGAAFMSLWTYIRNGEEEEKMDSSGFLNSIKSRIGELPSTTRRHWPWESIHRGAKKKKSDPEPSLKLTPDRPQPKFENPELCIGSIFGLDVGGTLAKLIYFEQRPDHHSGDHLHHLHKDHPSPKISHDDLRQLDFSPQRVRQKLAGKNHNHNSSNTDHHSPHSNDEIKIVFKLRQESMPDNLHAFGPTVTYDDDHVQQHDYHKTKLNGPNVPPTLPATHIGLKKSRSMLDLSLSQKSKDHAEALDRFYHFARNLDSYKEGIKDHKLTFYSRALGGEFHFLQFETRRMENAMELIRDNDLHLFIREMGATGGGAHKFANDWETNLGIQLKKQEELDSLVAGMQFVISTVVGECYTFRPRKSKRSGDDTIHSTTSSSSNSLRGRSFSSSGLSNSFSDESDLGEDEDVNSSGTDEWWWSRKVQRDSISYSSTYPYLLVTIGTGVSILRVDGPRKHERISGSTIGGGTYWGLIRLLTDLEDFEDVMRLAEHGDPSKVDMMVGDIYGDNKEALEKLGLPASLVASSFGKLVAREDPAAGLKQEDLARALLLMVTNNIGQVAYLNAQLHKTSRIYFVGNFLRGNKLSQKRLSFAINYWSKGKMEALFLEHEGYFGALGAFLLSQDICLDDLEPHQRQSIMSNKHDHGRSHGPQRRSHTLDY